MPPSSIGSGPGASQPPAGRQAAWWRWPLLGVLVGATLVCVIAYWIWFVGEDLATVEADFAIPWAMAVDLLLSLNALF
jgi:hypothetical protein